MGNTFHRTFDSENGGENRNGKYGVGDEIWWNKCLGLNRGYCWLETGKNGFKWGCGVV